MFDTYLIEVGGEAAGLVFREGQVFRFYATARSFFVLEGRSFPTPADAERAAALLRSPDCGDKANRRRAPKRARAIAGAPLPGPAQAQARARARARRRSASLWHATWHRWLGATSAPSPLPHTQAKGSEQ